MGAIKQQKFGQRFGQEGGLLCGSPSEEDLGVTAYEAFKDDIVLIYPSWTSWDTLSPDAQEGFRALATACFSLGYERGYEEGRKAGYSAGYASGHKDGYDEGLADGEDA